MAESKDKTPTSKVDVGSVAHTTAALGAGFAPGAGIADLFGQMPDPFNPGQMSPSFSENIGKGDYLGAGLQVLGGAGDALYMLGATAPLGAALKGAQALGKAARGSKVLEKTDFFDAMGDQGALLEFPEIGENLSKYIYDIDFNSLNKALSSDEYLDYADVLRANLDKTFSGDKIPVSRTENYSDPKAGVEGKREKRFFEVDKDDVLFAGYEAEGELIVRGPQGNPMSVRIETSPELQRVKADIPVFLKPQRKWEDLRPGGDYIHPGTNEVLTGRSPSSGRISVDPSGKASFLVSSDNLESVGDPKGALVKTNLFKRSAGWRPNNEAVDLPTLVSVEHRGKHYYTTDVDFTKGVNLSKYPNQRDEPRLRPTVKGNLDFGEEIGTISVRGREHPVYGKIEVKAKGGIVGLPVDNRMINPEILSQIERIMGR